LTLGSELEKQESFAKIVARNRKALRLLENIDAIIARPDANHGGSEYLGVEVPMENGTTLAKKMWRNVRSPQTKD